MKLLIITVNYKSADQILLGINEVVQQLRHIGDSEYWIIDNASPDRSADSISEAIIRENINDIVKVVRSPINGGFGAGNNIGIQKALKCKPPEYIHLLNPDAYLEPGCLIAFVSFMEIHSDVAICGGPLLDLKGDFQCGAFRFPSTYGEFESLAKIAAVSYILKAYRISIDLANDPHQTDWVSGANIFFRGSIFSTIGDFDEDFFLYYEEVDLCYRARQLGVKVYMVPSAAVRHVGGTTTGKGSKGVRYPKTWFESRFRYFRKTMTPAQEFRLHAASILAIFIQILKSVLQGRKPEPPHFLSDYIGHFFIRYTRKLWKI
jgi:GT2 family glycosyltransferase